MVRGRANTDRRYFRLRFTWIVCGRAGTGSGNNLIFDV